MSPGNDTFTTGLEACLKQPPSVLSSGRFGLLANQASVDRHYRYSWDLMSERFPGRLAALFAPQHGLWCEQQANMIETPHNAHNRLEIPVYSLYSETRRPTHQMLAGLDCLVIDLQDVGTRVYTFVWTISHCLEACAERQIPVLILDRPNPLGGQHIEGPLLQSSMRSFVGRASIPMRHALTIAELARVINDELRIHADLHVVPMCGWSRRMSFAEMGRAWLAPSPNLARLQGVQLYPGQVLLEGTNLSEGRGTTTPFEVVGAPFIDPERLCERLDQLDLPGVTFRPVRFVPTFDKWRQASCGGVYLHITDKEGCRPYRTTIALLAAVNELWPTKFAWQDPPYEYESEKMPIDILSGSDRLRNALTPGRTFDVEELQTLSHADSNDWWHRVEPYLLYEKFSTMRPS